jgi:[ribosomal protein S5]-alanine N-acetyltransferase
MTSILLTPVLLSSRLLLRPFEHEDAPALARLFNDPAVAMGVCSAPLPFTELHASARIMTVRAREAAGKAFVWGVEDTQGLLIGTLGLTQTAPAVFRLGYAYARAYWGKGIASEAMTSMMDWASRHLGGSEIYGEVFTDNPASARVLAKAGFVEVGTSARFSLARDGNEQTRTFSWKEAA